MPIPPSTIIGSPEPYYSEPEQDFLHRITEHCKMRRVAMLERDLSYTSNESVERLLLIIMRLKRELRIF